MISFLGHISGYMVTGSARSSPGVDLQANAACGREYLRIGSGLYRVLRYRVYPALCGGNTLVIVVKSKKKAV